MLGTLCFLLSACDNQQQPSGNTPGLTLQKCTWDTATGIPPAVGGAECGSFSVAENPDDPAAGSIALNIKRWPSISAVPDADPVFVIAGGPGQSATAIADRLVQVFYNLRKSRDIVFVDQRGTGQSAPLNCEQDESSSLTDYAAYSAEKSLASLHLCADALRDRAAFYTTPYAVGDLEQVRKALGYGPINLWGGSYGTRVILHYMVRYPDSLRAVVMDGLAPVSLALPHSIGRDATRALGLVASQCLSMDECAQRYGDINKKAEQLADTLRQQPVHLTVANPLTGISEDILLDDSKLAVLVRLALYDRVMSRLLPKLIASASAGDYTLLANLMSQFLNTERLPDLAQGMHMTILCNEDASIAAVPEHQPFLGVDLAENMREVCAFWPESAVPASYYEPVVSDIPALLFSGVYDPVTPPEWGEQVLAHLTQATHLTAPGAHHGVTMEGCASDVMTQFIRDRVVHPEQSRCIEDIQPLQPYLDAPPTEQGARDD